MDEEKKVDEQTLLEKELNSDKVIDKELLTKIYDTKENGQKMYDDIKSYIKKEYNIKDDNQLLNAMIRFAQKSYCFEKTISLENFLYEFENFKFVAREYIIARKNRFIFLYRQEELMSQINSIQKELEEYHEFSSTHTDQEVMIKYSNQKLGEFAAMRTQTLPMFMVELETLATAIRDNEKTYSDTEHDRFSSAFYLLRVLHTVLELHEFNFKQIIKQSLDLDNDETSYDDNDEY